MVKEHILSGGRTAAEIVRIGNTVRRQIGPNSDFTHALLKLLERKRFDYSPRFLGIDEKGREILTFIKGSTPHENIKWTNDQLVTIHVQYLVSVLGIQIREAIYKI